MDYRYQLWRNEPRNHIAFWTTSLICVKALAHLWSQESGSYTLSLLTNDELLLSASSDASTT